MEQKQIHAWKDTITTTTILIAVWTIMLLPSLRLLVNTVTTTAVSVGSTAVGRVGIRGNHSNNNNNNGDDKITHRHLRNGEEKSNEDKNRKCSPLSEEVLELQKEEIRLADDAWLQAAVAKDVELTLSFWSEDATVIAPGEAPRVGHDSIRDMLTGLFVTLEGSSITWEVSKIDMNPYGGVGYAYWTNQINFGETSGIQTFYGQGVSTWTMQDDTCEWKVTLDIWNEQQQQPQ